MVANPRVDIEGEIRRTAGIIGFNSRLTIGGRSWMCISFSENALLIDKGLSFKTATIVIVQECTVVSIESNCILEVDENIIELGTV